MKRALFAVLAVASLCGCQKPSDALVGSWNGVTTYDGSAVDALGNDQKSQFMASVGAPKITLELKSNMNYRITFGSSQPLTGTWALAENKEYVTFTPTASGPAGSPEPKPIIFSVSDKMDELGGSNSAYGISYTITFKRPKE